MERQDVIKKVRALSKECGEAFLKTEAGGAVTYP
jgi:glycyl-tRNA synthetase alpha subunit